MSAIKRDSSPHSINVLSIGEKPISSDVVGCVQLQFNICKETGVKSDSEH
jgi:hypothetical protein